MSTVQPPKNRRPWLPTFGQVAAVISLLGFGSLCFIVGAATMHAGGTSAKPLAAALAGAETWFGGSRAPHFSERPPPGLSICKEDRAFDGLTLVTTTGSAECHLYDRAGKVVHHWTMPPGGTDAKDKGSISWEQCHLYPNGDLLALCSPAGDKPYAFGVVKLDKDSRLLWQRKGHFHHDLEVGEDGRIFLFELTTLTQRPPGLESLPEDSQDERIVVLSPEGHEERSFSLLGAFLGTPYLETLLSVNAEETESGMLPGPMPPQPPGMPFPPGIAPHQGNGSNPAAPAKIKPTTDIFHANSVRVLRKAMADKFPLFKTGQLLLSLHTPSLLVVLDLDRQTVVWAAKGPWQRQHDAQFLDNGHLLLMDNLGSPSGSRVLEYDPTTYAVSWSSNGTKETTFRTIFRGRCQRLPNGNTRITDTQQRIFEVTPEKEVVWQLGFANSDEHSDFSITGSTVYYREELPFLK